MQAIEGRQGLAAGGQPSDLNGGGGGAVAGQHLPAALNQPRVRAEDAAFIARQRLCLTRRRRSNGERCECLVRQGCRGLQDLKGIPPTRRFRELENRISNLEKRLATPAAEH